MASQFKNRLVGITILVALVVIFLPSLIDGKKNTYQQEFAATPIKPELKEHSQSFSDSTPSSKEELVIENEEAEDAPTEVTSEWKVEEVASAVVVEDNKVTNPKTVTPAPPKAVKAPVFDDPAWTIQLGAFQNKANINSLLKKLNKAGFQAHTIPREVMDGQLTRVFVGPNVSKQKLTDMLPRLKSLTNLNGKVIPFNPIEP
ncbi:SPOR domain-containing protein [Psychromonas sp. 14N.309.X.WAT.B.A12]|uniref:SPOR domain-containing protein n=1 Tax=unclassified Psychromonas TaxID=2614957 RepID=UPI0025B0CFCC|nr:SPOR domain-containing protein [Psychromonas sp. 14N.309.X.WAT.B.A12]MDN2662142.1 SPOR domain-containing protein [Psychromonas sp. 14N.309.X.WAT.B.A12]